MKILNIRQKRTAEYLELSADVFYGKENLTRNLWFRFPVDLEDLNLTADPFLLANLADCMWKNENIEIDGEISQKLFGSLEMAMDFLTMKMPDFSRIKVHAKIIKKSESAGILHGCFFSGGVDSSYTFLKNKDDIDALVVMRGQDMSLNPIDDFRWESLLNHARAIGREYNKKVIPVVTNIRFYEGNSPRASYKFWAEAVDGSFMAATGLALSSIFNKIYFASGLTFVYLEAHGCHLLLDPLWSTEKVDFIHDGCEANRLNKIIRQVSKSEVVLDGLRVCCKNRDKKYNCCRCQKCLKTMVCLKIAGVLDKCASFPETINLRRISRIWMGDTNLMHTWKELYIAAKKQNMPELARAIRRGLRRSKIFNFFASRNKCIQMRDDLIIKLKPMKRKILGNRKIPIFSNN